MRLIALSVVCIFVIALALAGIVMVHGRHIPDCPSSTGGGVALCR